MEIGTITETAYLITLTPENILALIGIGLLGGILSGFLGSGGAFIMTPAMMNLGIPGILAVAANITHKFGKAIQGAKKHNELGNVDKKLGIVMFVALLTGVKLAFHANSGILKQLGEAYSDLYINTIFVLILSFVTVLIIIDIIKRRGSSDNSTAKVMNTKWLEKLNVPPVIYFPVAKVHVSLWVVLLVGLTTGFLAGTVGVGGFIGVTAMIYILRMTPQVAAGTELFLAIFSGAYGAYLYTINGYLDIRIVLLLYLGSLIGIYIGAIGNKIVTGLQIRIIMAITVGMVTLSRAVSLPGNLVKIEYIFLSEKTTEILHFISTIILFGSGIISVLMITYLVINNLYGKKPAFKLFR
ncbi:sulfite exporter TauE/SafE family protein [Desulfoscipio gibsoniae]|uniref:Probable membrane transporter protein n=1 Tax=Desulfoscipio gibsoniae DSM 7213 TaxID=767817 RepID=R4KLD1_9FIRM|nr:sulfite exporter TauE/SafE family protein [Desulfoscipio gibsoniae]AGL03469.1 putative permease [Desulfoscipio gibsoniae DSM 7213]